MGPEIAILGILAFGLMCVGLVCWGTHIDEQNEQREQLARVVSSPGALPGERLAVLPQVQAMPATQMGFHDVNATSIVAPISFSSPTGFSEAGFIADDGSPVCAFDDVRVHSTPEFQTEEISREEWASDLGEIAAMADDVSWSWNVGEGIGLVAEHSDFVSNEMTSNATWTDSVYDAPLSEHATASVASIAPEASAIAALPMLSMDQQQETVLKEISAAETSEEAEDETEVDAAERIVSEFAAGATRVSGKKRTRIRRTKNLGSSEFDVQMPMPLATDSADIPTN